MIQFRKTCLFKIISIGLIFMFLFHVDGLLSKEESPASMFEKAKKDYIGKNFERAAFCLQRLILMDGSIEKKSEEIKSRYGQALLLLGACQENLKQVERAEENYSSAKQILGKDFFIKKINLKHLAIYRKFLERKEDTRQAGPVIISSGKKRVMIEKVGKKRKGKKFPWLLVAGGVVVAGVVVYFLIKSNKYKLKVDIGEGIIGTPENGTHKYKKDEIVNYNYNLQRGYRDLVVTLDGNPVPASGSIEMNGNHSLSVSATKIGQVNSVVLKFRVRFAATNLRVRHRIWVDSNMKVDQVFDFKVRSSDDWDDALKIYWSFEVNRGTGPIHIQQEAGPYYGDFYPRNSWIWPTYYEVEVVDYTYVGGADPGRPTLSESWFYLKVAPWETNPYGEWYRIKTKEITINPSSGTAFQETRKASKDIPKSSFNIEGKIEN
jgi:hypothetical protein